jgi:hypothetical protein
MTMKHLLMVGAILALGLSACAASNAQLRSASSGHVGCAPDEIAIENYNLGVSTSSWTALCKGKSFYCSGSDTLKGVSCASR